MIRRIPGPGRPRGNAVVHDGRVYAVATARDKVPSLYEQTKQSLALLDASLAEAGSDKRHILQATVYVTDMAQKPEMNRAWEEWIDFDHPPVRACLGVALEGQDLVEIVVAAAVKEI